MNGLRQTVASISGRIRVSGLTVLFAVVITGAGLRYSAARAGDSAQKTPVQTKKNQFWANPRYADFVQSFSNAEKLQTLFLLYANRHHGVLPNAATWEKDLRPLASERKMNFESIIRRPLRGHPRRFVMNKAAANCDVDLLADTEDFVLFFENSPDIGQAKGVGATQTLIGSSSIPTNGCKFVVYWKRSVEPACGVDAPTVGPSLTQGEWSGTVIRSNTVTQALKRRTAEESRKAKPEAR